MPAGPQPCQLAPLPPQTHPKWQPLLSSPQQSLDRGAAPDLAGACLPLWLPRQTPALGRWSSFSEMRWLNEAGPTFLLVITPETEARDTVTGTVCSTRQANQSNLLLPDGETETQTAKELAQSLQAYRWQMPSASCLLPCPLETSKQGGGEGGASWNPPLLSPLASS